MEFITNGKVQNAHTKKWKRNKSGTTEKQEKKNTGIEGTQKKEHNNIKETENSNQNRIREINEIIKSEYNLQMNAGKQNRHIRGTKEFDESKSELYLNPEMLYKKHNESAIPIMSTKGDWNSKKRFEHETNTGTYKNFDGTEQMKTKRGIIHYLKNKGWHIVPSRTKGSIKDD